MSATVEPSPHGPALQPAGPPVDADVPAPTAAPEGAPTTGRGEVPDAAGPSASTTRLAILVLTLLASAGFAGLLLHNAVRGREWLVAVRDCLEQHNSGATSSDPFRAQAAAQTCEASAERLRGLFGLAAMGIAVVLVIVAAIVEARRVERGRRLTPLEPILPASALRARELAREAGVEPPGLMLRFGNQSDAFTYGVPGRYRIALPRGIAVRPGTPVFDATLRHELQHIAHRDVALAWSLRGTAIVLGALVVPVTLVPLWHDPGFVIDILWRAVVLAVVVLLALNAWLRAREFDADARAAGVAGDADQLVTTLSTFGLQQARPAGRVRSWLAGARANHPTASSRIAALRRPELLPTTGLVDGLTIGFAVALSRPLIESFAGPLLSAQGHSDLLPAVVSWVAGPLAGVTLGLGLFRHALYRPLSGERPVGPVVALGVLVGSFLGQGTTPAASGLGGFGGLNHPVSGLVTAGGLAGATLLSAGLAEVLVGARLPRRLAPVAVAALSALLFTGVLWVCAVVQLLIDELPWAVTSMAVVILVPSVPLALLALSLAGAVFAALARGSQGLRRAVAAGVLSGAAAASVIVTYRLTQGPAPTDAALEARFYAYLALTALTAAVAGGVVQALGGPSGGGEALACAVLSAMVTSAGFLALNTALGGELTADYAWSIMHPAVALTLVVLVGVALLGGAVTVLLRNRRFPTAVTVVAVTVASLATSVGVLAGRGQLLPGFSSGATTAARPSTPFPSPAPSTPFPSPAPSASIRPVTAAEYVGTVAPALTSAFGQVQQLATTALQAGGGPERSAAIDAQVLPAIRRLLTMAEHMTSADADVTAAHRHFVASVRLELSAFEQLSRGLRTGDQALVSAGASTTGRATQELRAWAALVQVVALH